MGQKWLEARGGSAKRGLQFRSGPSGIAIGIAIG